MRKPDPLTGARDLSFHPADPNGGDVLTVSQIEQFNRDGYISGVRIFDTKEADDLRVYIDNLIEQVISAPDQRNSYSINTYHVVCERLYELAVEPRILACVKDLLGEEVVLWGSHLFAKMSGDGKVVPMHQDAVYWPLTPSKSVSVWLAIDDADAENAAMQFVPASHRLGPLEHEELGLGEGRVLGRQVVEPEQYAERFVNVLKSGEISMHSDLLLHGSDANRSDRRRAGMTLRYTHASVRLIDGYDSWRKSAVHVMKGDVDEFWYNRRRPEGEHPEKMADLWGGFDGQEMEQAKVLFHKEP